MGRMVNGMNGLHVVRIVIGTKNPDTAISPLSWLEEYASVEFIALYVCGSNDGSELYRINDVD